MVPTECPVVEGELPSSLEGAAYIRNGPNPQFLPQRALHSFEGDGMLHSLRFSNGRAIYCSRYVKTYKYTTERDAGGPVILNFFSGFYGLIDVARYFRFIGQSMKGQVERLKGFGGANINVAFFGKKLMALCESDLPYIIDLTQDGDIETLGRWEFDMRMFANMTAHPKVDEVTKETSAYRVNFLSPFLTFFRFDENGVKQNEVNILSMKQPSLIHDFGVTKRFMIFGETQLVLNTAKMIWGRGSLLEYRPTITPRIGILPRYATDDSDLMWLEAPGFNPLHVLNAWENGEDEIVMVATNIKSLENILVKRVFTTLEKLVINMRTGKLISRKSLSPKPLELGSINPSYAGKRNRYVYMAVMDEIPRASGVVKIDVETGREVGSRFFGAGCFGGEALFVRKETENAASEDEDDGYVVTCTHDENSGDSMFVVMDAKSPELDIVAAVQVPRRVPYGFHGLFLTREDLSSL
nr:carotenoid cleavage dioxygenase 4 isoform 4 [Bixa orellana]